MSTVERILKPSTTKKNNIITVTGVSGSGKDYLVGQALTHYKNTWFDEVTIFNFGTELFNFLTAAPSATKIDNRDAMKNLSSEEIDDSVSMAIASLLALQPALNLAHVAFFTKGKMQLNPGNEKIINPHEYIFVRSAPELIQAWRQAENSRRQRPTETLDQIQMHQNLAYLMTYGLAQSLGLGLIVINNDPAFTDRSVSVIAEETNTYLR
ncbi:MAG TPA: hypothetical protein VD999_00305 [Vitreimonas sp.]|nr:hypothetical protein [Vitreimonas sp.]